MDEIELLKEELARERRARKQAELLLEEKSLDLYRRGEELGRKAEQLIRSNGELEQFAYSASHDLQAPLRTIAGFSKLLERRCRDKLDAEGLEYLGFIDAGSKRLHQLINDLLEYSRVGRTEYKPSWIDAQQMIRELGQQLHSSLQQAQLRFEELPQIYADRTHIARVFQNLVDNGIKFRRPEVTPEVSIKAVDLSSEWQFDVCDNGIGMKPEHLERIFGIFARLHGEDAYPGTGVGLPICKKIVERHGGRLWVESAPGVGSCFHFTLPKPQQTPGV